MTAHTKNPLRVRTAASQAAVPRTHSQNDTGKMVLLLRKVSQMEL